MSTLHELLASLSCGSITIEKIIGGLFSTIDNTDEHIHSFLSLAHKNELIQQAEEKSDLPLRGLPIAVKDNISTTGFPLSCGSSFLEKFHPIFEATAIQRLRNSGATILGKTNLDEFAMGSSTENSAFFPTCNPIDQDRVPGGSSGGSAAAVASGQAICALGTDTGGSVRQPASLCGVVGLRPTYGLVSRYGLVAFASSLDQIGTLTTDVEDSALLLELIAGEDENDATCLPGQAPSYRDHLEQGISGTRIGIPREYIAEELSDQASKLIDKWRELAADLGAEIVEISLPHTPYALPTYYLIASSEASANLARYDGVRYTSISNSESLENLFANSRTQGFGDEVKRRVMLGTYALSAGYYDKYYGKAQHVRRLVAQDFEQAFKEVDLMLTPTSPTPAFRLGEKEDPISMYLADLFTIPSSLAGVPAISIPGGKVDNLPFGLQLIANRQQESLLFRGAIAFENELS